MRLEMRAAVRPCNGMVCTEASRRRPTRGVVSFGAVCLLSLLSFGCESSGRLIPAEIMVRPAGGFEVTPSEAWNRVAATAAYPEQVERWTRHGEFLDSLTFFAGLPEGTGLRATRQRVRPYTPFRTDITVKELAALLEEYYERGGGNEQFRIIDVEDTEFLTTPGHRIDFEFRDRYELLWRGRAYVAIRGERLYMMLFDAAALHYFDDGLKAVDAMVERAVAR